MHCSVFFFSGMAILVKLKPPLSYIARKSLILQNKRVILIQ